MFSIRRFPIGIGGPAISLKTRTVLLFFVSFYSFIFLPLIPLWAQSFDLLEDTDLFAPVIQHQALEETVQPGVPYTLKAKVTDNIGVTEVILYYRIQGKEFYSSLNMKPAGKGTYSAVLPQEDIVTPGIEYYIQASDRAGNTSQRAFPFSPLVIDVVVTSKDEILPSERAPFALSTEKPTEAQTISGENPWYKKWWVWTIVVAVVGGVAAASGGGGGGQPTAGAPTTGTIDVTGPVP